MTLPYGVISDCHYHKWDAFSTTNAEGLNSRLEIQLEATKEAAIAMKKAGCKYMLVDGNITAEWSTMDVTKKGEYRDKFNISVQKKGSSKSFQTLSGGEKRKVRIACSLALQDLVSNRASKNIDLFIGDEIDDALDTAGLERLMGILESKARERGTVLIISHKEMKSWFRETITLEVKEGRSYVV